MAINVAINPVDDTEMTIITGVVEKIMYKEKPDQFQNTHQASMVVDGTWVNMRLKVKDGYEPQVRFAEGKGPQAKWMTLNEGDTVKMVVKPNEWNGKTYYQVSSSGIKVTKKGEGKPATQKPAHGASSGSAAPSSGSSWKKDITGVEVGHALNSASQIVGIEDFDALLETAKDVHVETIKLKEWYRKANPNMSDYDVGAAAGHAMKMACVPGASAASAAAVAKEILSKVVAALTAYVKGEEATPAEAEAAKAPPKAQAKPAPKAAPKPQPKAVEPEPDFGDDDFDNDLPF